MSPFRCFVCSQPCIEFPADFKARLTEFIPNLNKLQPSSLNCSELNNLVFCQSCWVHFMRLHKLDVHLSVKKESCDAKIELLLSKIGRSHKSSVKSRNNTTTSCKVLNIQSSVRACSVEEELIEAADKSDSKTRKAQSAVQFYTVYEDKWVPKNATMPTSSKIVRRLSEVDFTYMHKYPFKATGVGFKCGLCTATCKFDKSRIIWDNMTKHILKWHKGNHKVRKNKVCHRLIQSTPNRFQYGEYIVEKIDGKYRCGQCGIIKAAGRKIKSEIIIDHIKRNHENALSSMTMTFVCECCGKVYRSQIGLKHHRLVKHEKSKKQFPCSDCDKIFTTRIRASVHRFNVHLHRGEFVCENCGKRFNTKGSLQTHVASVHNGQKLKCDDCGKIFGSKMALNVHRYSHTGKKYTCDICGMDFTQNYSVTRHKKIAHPQ